MAHKLSRRQIAAYAAEQYAQGNDVTSHLAAYLVDTKRTREVSLLVHDIEAALLTHSIAIADVVSARELTAKLRTTITQFVSETQDVDTVHLREAVDASVIGGVRIRTPGAELDATVRRRLANIMKAKV